jgi:glycosyltransferase involved in cell wall biosynthesis
MVERSGAQIQPSCARPIYVEDLAGFRKHLLAIDVLHVIDSLGEGGAENNLLSILRRLPSDRFRNHIAWLYDRDGLLEALRPTVASLIPLHASRTPLGLVRAASDLAEWMKQHHPHVVNAQLLMAHLVGRLAARSARVPHVTTWQNVIFDNKSLADFGGSAALRGLLLALDRETVGYDRGFIAVSEHVARRWIETAGARPELVTVIPNAVEPARYRECSPDELARTRAALALPADAEIVLSVGRLVRTKGHFEALAAMPSILARRPRTHLLIAGSGPMEAELRAAAAMLGGRVRILGQRRDLPCLYGIADAFLFATHYEGLSLALVELISSGLPGAISDIPPNREVADGLPSIRFFPVADVGQIAESVVAVLEGGRALRDKARALRASVGARFSPDALAQRVGAVLESAAGVPPRAAAAPLKQAVSR